MYFEKQKKKKKSHVRAHTDRQTDRQRERENQAMRGIAQTSGTKMRLCKLTQK